MSRRASIAGIAAATVSIAPLAGVAHAQDLDCRNFVFQEDAQAVFNQDPTDPNRLDEDQGPDDGIACEALPHRSTAHATAAVPSPTVVTPTRGVQGGVGSTSVSGPSGWDIGLGVGLTAGGVLTAAGYTVLRRRG